MNYWIQTFIRGLLNRYLEMCQNQNSQDYDKVAKIEDAKKVPFLHQIYSKKIEIRYAGQARSVEST